MASKNTAVLNASLPILFLGCSAALQMIASFLYLNSRPDIVLVCQAFAVTAGVYLLNRIMDKEDKFNNLNRWMFFNKTIAHTISWTLIAGLAIAGPVLLNLAVEKTGVALWFAVLATIGILYSVKIIPAFWKKKGLWWISVKDIPFLKSLIVCILWGASGLILASAASGQNVFRPDVLLIMLTFCICTLNSTVTADARDTEGDKIRKLLTIPVLWGEQGALALLMTINISSILALLICGAMFPLPMILILFCAACIIWTALSVLPQYTLRDKLSKTMTELLVDSHVMTTALGLIFLSFCY